MSVNYFLIKTEDLDAGLIAAWRSIQAREPCFESPYFCPEFTQAVGSVRDDVRVVVIENDAGRRASSRTSARPGGAAARSAARSPTTTA